MDPIRSSIVGRAFWSGLVTILIVDGFSPSSFAQTKRPTRLHSATQTYLDSLSGFGNTVVPPLQSFVETAASLTDDFTLAATTLLAESGVADLPPVESAAVTPQAVDSVVAATATDSVTSAADSVTSAADSVAAAAATATPPPEAIPAPTDDLWNLGSTVFQTTPDAAKTEVPLTKYWDSVVPKTVPSWYESVKDTATAKQEEFLASVLAQQQKTQAASSLLPKKNPLEGIGIGETFSGINNPFRNMPDVPSFSKLADASLMDIFSAMGRSLGAIARGFWYLLTAIVEFLSGGESSLQDVTAQIKVSIDQTVQDALETMRSSLYDLGQVTLQEALTFLLQIVIKFAELIFKLVSSFCQAFTGRGLDVWLESIGHGLTEQAVVATSALSTTVTDLSHASLAELAAILGSYGAAVARVLVDSPRSLADAFHATGGTELLQNTLSSTAVESTTSLLGSGTFPY